MFLFVVVRLFVFCFCCLPICPSVRLSVGFVVCPFVCFICLYMFAFGARGLNQHVSNWCLCLFGCVWLFDCQGIRTKQSTYYNSIADHHQRTRTIACAHVRLSAFDWLSRHLFWNDTPAGVHVRSHRARICSIIAITFQIPIAQHISFVFPIICHCGGWRVVDAYLFGNINVYVRFNGRGRGGTPLFAHRG